MLYDYHLSNIISILYYLIYSEILQFARTQMPISFHPCTNLSLHLSSEPVRSSPK